MSDALMGHGPRIWETNYANRGLVVGLALALCFVRVGNKFLRARRLLCGMSQQRKLDPGVQPGGAFLSVPRWNGIAGSRCT
eukprot:2356544-Rhodomonas_salina.1